MTKKNVPIIKDRGWFWSGWLMIILGISFILILEEHPLIALGWIIGGIVECRIGMGLNTEEHGDNVKRQRAG